MLLNKLRPSSYVTVIVAIMSIIRVLTWVKRSCPAIFGTHLTRKQTSGIILSESYNFQNIEKPG